MNQKELEKRTNEGLAYILKHIVNREIGKGAIAEELMRVNSAVYDNTPESDVRFGKHLRFCMNAAKYVRGEYSPTFLLFQAKGVDELINDENCNREFEIVDRAFDEAICKIGNTILGEVDYFTREETIPHLKITAGGVLEDLRMLERCRIRGGLKRTIGAQEDLERVLKETCEVLERKIAGDKDPELKAKHSELKRQYEVTLSKLKEFY